MRRPTSFIAGGKVLRGPTALQLDDRLARFEADIRARHIVKKYLPYMDQAQAERAVKLATSYDPEFQRLRRERAQHFANANDGSTLTQNLLDNQLDILDLVAKVRLRIATEIMTKEQIKSARADFQRQAAFPQ